MSENSPQVLRCSLKFPHQVTQSTSFRSRRLISMPDLDSRGPFAFHREAYASQFFFRMHSTFRCETYHKLPVFMCYGTIFMAKRQISARDWIVRCNPARPDLNFAIASERFSMRCATFRLKHLPGFMHLGDSHATTQSGPVTQKTDYEILFRFRKETEKM